MYAPECGVCMRAQKPQGLGSILDFATDGGVHWAVGVVTCLPHNIVDRVNRVNTRKYFLANSKCSVNVSALLLYIHGGIYEM